MKIKQTIKRIAVLAACLILLVGAIPSSASSYSTYTYSIDGEPLPSPPAYTPEIVISSASIKNSSGESALVTAIKSPTDLEADSDGNIYIADPEYAYKDAKGVDRHGRIVVISEYYQLKFVITEFVNSNGVDDCLNAAKGVFIWKGNISTDDRTLDIDGDGYYQAKYIYVADTENKRIVVFDENGNYMRHFGREDFGSADVLEEDDLYKPVALAVDDAGRVYVVSSTTYQGVISLTDKGEFAGYIGAQKVTYNALQLIWRKFQTAAQKAASDKNISTEYNNITIDKKGFLYVTSNSIDQQTLITAIQNNDTTYAPVKQINTSGTDIMRRNGFHMPAGEIAISRSAMYESDAISGPSSIVDVALGPEGTWSIIDSKRSKIYTYDSNGELLFIFGDTGTQMGNIKVVSAITYLGDKMLVLDSETAAFTVYKRTQYGNLLITALEHENQRLYDLAEEDWKAILQRNNNFDAAYIGLGKAYYNMGNWDKAMEYFKTAYATERYSKAFSESRKEWAEKYFIVIPIVAVAFCVLVGLFFKYAGKVNSKAAVSGKKKTYWQEILYAFHVIFHPFDGFWDMKHEKRGSVRAAFTILALTAVVFAWQAVGQSFIFSPGRSYVSILAQLSGLLVPLVLWVTSNWCLTTLFDGEGSFKDIFVACSYSLTPIVMLVPIATLLTHVLTSSEAGFVSLITNVCYVWLFLLLFFGTMVTHDYSLGKNILTIIGTVLVMCIIMFVSVLFSGLLIKMASFVSNIITEIQYHM